MKERIEKLIAIIKKGRYDEEQTHYDYDDLLKDFILNYDPELFPLMKELIELKKWFWYA